MALPAGILVTGWVDPPIVHGHDVRSLAAELGYLPFIGPTGYVLLRRFSLMLGADLTKPAAIDTTTLARSIGLQAGGGTSRLATTIDRLERFKTVRWIDPAHLAARTQLPRLTAHQMDKLEPGVRSTYQAALRHGQG